MKGECARETILSPGYEVDESLSKRLPFIEAPNIPKGDLRILMKSGGR
jgi:hypothetical protein